MRNKKTILAVLTAIGMLLVLLMGALVTKTESGRGCGDDWPLCNGKFIPAYTIESLIEYSHRFVTGIEGLLVLATAIMVFRYFRKSWEALLYALSALFFTFLQAILGAMAVKMPQSSAVMALHFGFSLMAVASTVLLAIWIWRSEKSKQLPHRSDSLSKGDATVEITGAFRIWVWFTAVYCYIVVYLGAYLRHTDSMAGCSGWPLCNGELIPEMAGATGIAFIHRVAAFVLLMLVTWLYVYAQRSFKHISVIRSGTGWALLLIVLQVISGGFVTITLGTDWQLLSSLLHTVIISSFFAVICFLSIQVFKLPLYTGQVSPPISSREELV